ncbi:Major facilitator superfamily and Major facilitator superfamily domain, general substrate transporter and Major facilitator superfamily domain-containing protein [Strongyloides ratti]|uniref:Major facilitator superfamily and Major facilitator superfamily domain, general substrate transporter and Major facilitator superfamily domain-containing protein n=1 Tax=Strongyloides ratti TaxID=34506 RepID=A0A090LMC5_STRRB|nr:Major facilitator superfamily and Major facilitator superfamily domain, general substrate transporter and Major facilitator superfamily domain-containing protein [Strongyloides ratti]CEF70896.1 Major facilitator superfamily and Major facilitator superfamily domain, general substrate transporter and Major facilitator superfamily domain-containing protein [Strongyloides ratti]
MNKSMSVLHQNYGTTDNTNEFGNRYFGESSFITKWFDIPKIKRRHVLAFMAFLGFVNIYAMRANLSVAIIEMTSPKYIQNGSITITKTPDFEWDKMTQGLILASFFNGYIFTQIPGSYLSSKYGGSKIFLLGIFGTACLTVLTPPLSYLGKYVIISIRFLEGLFEGVTYPAMVAIWAKWAPYTEKSRLASFAFSGSYFGTVISLSLSAYIGEIFGWQMIFYFFGIISIIWSYFWIKIIRENPEDDLYITGDELALIKTSTLPPSNVNFNWRQALITKSVWAIIAAHFCQNWGFYTMLAYLPNILKDLTHYKIETVGVFSAIPYWLMGFILIYSGMFSDKLLERLHWPVEKVRKSSFTSSSGLLIFCIVLSIGAGGLPWSAFSVNTIDIAPQFAGQLMGLSNTLATFPGMISPLIVGSIVINGTYPEWNIIFYLTSLIQIIGAGVFYKFASGDIVEWAKEPSMLPAAFTTF